MNLKKFKIKKVYNSYKKNFSKLLSPQMSNCKSDNQKPQDENLESAFECNICLDTAKNAVISMCGHLFCWPCLHQWLETEQKYQLCPVCKAAISKQKVIPLYGRGSSNEDPREKLPPRPKAQRSEPENNNFFGQSFSSSFNFDVSNLQVAFGIGAFPFAILASTFNFIDNRPPINPQDNLEERTLNKTFLLLAFFFIFWLLVA